MSYNFTTANYDELTQADKKRYYKLQLKDQLAELQSIFKSVLATRIQTKAQIQKYQNSLDQFSQDYINGLVQRENENANSAYQSYQNKAEKALEKARRAVDDNHAITDLSDVRIDNAIKIIQASGSEIQPEVCRRLVNEFAGDQTSLTMLQGVFKAVGSPYDGGLDKMIYDVDSAFSQASESLRDHLLSQDGSLNYVARRVAVIANGEGCDFPTEFDPTEVDRATRRAAGLPVE
jgi:ElaB/YqjD/DUF883 family membrane-anchored ribosome-binding protein